MSDIPTTQGTAEWHEWRRKGIGATDASAICGYSEWGSPMTVFVVKTQQLPKEEQNEYQEWGSRIEPILIDKIADEYKSQITAIERGGLYVSDEYSWAKASLDGCMQLNDGSLCIIECKTGKTAEKWSPVPDGYYAQAQWQMYVTGVEQVIFSVLIRGTEWFDRIVERDQNFIDNMVAVCKDFWENNVLKNVLPSVTNGKHDPDALTSLLKLQGEDRPEKEIPQELVTDYLLKKQIASMAQENFDIAKANIQALMVDSTNLVCDGQRVASFISRAGNYGVNKKLLQEIAPDVYQQVLVRGSPVGYVKFNI